MVINLDATYHQSIGMDENGEILYSDEVYKGEIPPKKFQQEFYNQHPYGAMTSMFDYWKAYLLCNGYATEEELASKGGYYAT